MNRIYRVVWSSVAHTWVVASELAKGRKKASRISSAALVVAVIAAPGFVQATDYTSTVFVQGAQAIALNNDSVTTTADDEYGLLALDPGSVITAQNVRLDTSGVSAHGAAAADAGTAEFMGGSISTAGESAAGLFAVGSGTTINAAGMSIGTIGLWSSAVLAANTSTVTLNNVTIETRGEAAYGLEAYDVGTSLETTHTGITTTGQGSIGAVAFDGALITFHGGSVITDGDASDGLDALGSGAIVNANDLSVMTQGQTSVGAAAVGGGSMDLIGGSITTTGVDSIGLTAIGPGSTISVDGTHVMTRGGAGGQGLSAFGVNAEQGATIQLTNGTSISTEGSSAYGVRAIGAGSQVVSRQSTISTTGDQAGGVMVLNGAKVSVLGGSVQTSGNASSGLLAAGVGSAVTAEGVHVVTTGGAANDLGSYGVDVEQGASITLTNGSVVSTQGDHGLGLRVSGAGSNLSADQTTISTVGDSAFGAVAMNGGALNLGQDTSITTAGSKAHGLVSIGEASTINATGSAIRTTGDQADGLFLIDSNASLIDSTVEAQGTGITLSAATTTTRAVNTVQLSRSSVASVSGDAIFADAGTNTVTLSEGTQVRGGNGVLLNVVNAGTLVNLSADGGALLIGDIQAQGFNMANASLTDQSVWTGAARNMGDVAIDATSVWNITNNSDVHSLALAGTAGFVPAGGYKSLTVHGNLVGNGGTLVLNTLLNAGGPLANQSTDRVLVQGNATGTTYLKIMGTGNGALTDTNQNGVPEAKEGISLVQVAGESSAAAFKLSGGYVAVGPWRYDLTAYKPGAADASQRVVAGTSSGYWDYRLQNAYAPDPTPTPDSASDPTPNPTSRPAVVPQVPSYLSASTAMLSYGMRSLGTLHDRLGEIHQDDVSQSGNTDEFYARWLGGNYQYKSNRSASQYGYDFDQNDRGIQIGGTWMKMGDGASTFRLGMYGSIGVSHITPQAVDGSSAMRMNASSVAATGTYVHSSGLYVDGVVARNYYDTQVDTAYRGRDMAHFKTHGWSYSLESGYPFVFGDGLRLEPQAQVVYQSLHTNRFGDSDGLSVTPQNTGAWMGRVGANLGKTLMTGGGQRWTPWVRLNYLWGSGGRSTVNVASEAWDVSGTLPTSSWGQVWQLGAGVTGSLTRTVSVYAGADYQTNAGSAGEQGWSTNVGLRWQF